MVSPKVVSRSHIIDRISAVQPAEAVLGVTLLPHPPVQVTAPVYNNTQDTALHKHRIKHLKYVHCLTVCKCKQVWHFNHCENLKTEVQSRFSAYFCSHFLKFLSSLWNHVFEAEYRTVRVCCTIKFTRLQVWGVNMWKYVSSGGGKKTYDWYYDTQ